MSKYGQQYNENLTQKEMFEMGRKYEREQMAEHSEVEGLVEIKEIRKTIKDTLEPMGQTSNWVDIGIERICFLYEQALLTHSAKEREEMLIRVLQEIDDAETEHNPARHGTEPHDIFGLVKSYVGGIVFEIYGRYDALTPQTDVTRN